MLIVPFPVQLQPLKIKANETPVPRLAGPEAKKAHPRSLGKLPPCSAAGVSPPTGRKVSKPNSKKSKQV